MIRGGYYLKARKSRQSEVAIAPPHVREIWDYLMGSVKYEDCIVNGVKLHRGQNIYTYQGIIDQLAWFVGWRRKAYTRAQCETAMKWLKKRCMITTRRATGGLMITIVNYDVYQDPSNYENHSEVFTKAIGGPQGEPQGNPTGEPPALKDRRKKKKREYSTDSVEYDLSAYLFGYIKRNNEDARNPDFQSWSDVFRRMIEIDKRDAKDIRSRIRWSQQDDFWHRNILSPKKLRDKWDKLTLEMRKKSNVVSVHVHPKLVDEEEIFAD